MANAYDSSLPRGYLRQLIGLFQIATLGHIDDPYLEELIFHGETLRSEEVDTFGDHVHRSLTAGSGSGSGFIKDLRLLLPSRADEVDREMELGDDVDDKEEFAYLRSLTRTEAKTLYIR